MPKSGDAGAKRDPVWPFVMLYAAMCGGMIGTTLNRDPIKFEFSIAIAFGLIAIAGIVAYLAHGRLRETSIFPTLYEGFMVNLALHISTANERISLGTADF